MTLVSAPQPPITRTDRGLTITGTRITLYDVMDYWPDYPVRFIQGLFDLTAAQVNGAIAYIEANQAAVTAEYQQVLQSAAALQQYYEEKNRDLIAQIAAKPPQPGQEALYAKLREEQAKFGM
jgi:uncharacterized protein (DUF433 family)